MSINSSKFNPNKFTFYLNVISPNLFQIRKLLTALSYESSQYCMSSIAGKQLPDQLGAFLFTRFTTSIGSAFGLLLENVYGRA